jgi:hypothetical protein
MSRIRCALLTSLAVLLAALPAAADERDTAGERDIRVTETDDGYGYQFRDDPLNALGPDARGSVIKIRVRPERITLIRPRTSFVPEMLKSVEHI